MVRHKKYEVGAILKERPQSFLHFDLLTGITGEFWGGPTLLKLHPGASASLLQEKIRKDKIPTLTPGSTQYYVDALKNLYFNTNKNSKQQELPYFQQSDVPLLYIGLISALLVLAIACFNYTNLSLSRTLQQIKMIHIEKLMGAQLKEIRRQLFYDATLTVLLSFLFSLLLINDLLPWFNELLSAHLSLSFFFQLASLAIAFSIYFCHGSDTRLIYQPETFPPNPERIQPQLHRKKKAATDMDTSHPAIHFFL